MSIKIFIEVIFHKSPTLHHSPQYASFQHALMSWSWPITLLQHTAKPITKIISIFASSLSGK